MSWEEILKSLLVLMASLEILQAEMYQMKGMKESAKTMVILSASLLILTKVLQELGSMSLLDIAQSLLALIGVFVVLGVASKTLKPLIPTMERLAKAIGLFSLACIGIGVGVLALSVGLSMLALLTVEAATAIVAALEIIIVGTLGIIISSAKSIENAIKTIVFAVINVIKDCIPAIVDGILVCVEETLRSLAEHTPAIVGYLAEFLIQTLDSLTKYLPKLMDSIINFIMKFFECVVDALSKVNIDVLMKGILGVGILALVVRLLSGIASLVPSAMLGVLGIGAIMAEIALILAGIGALSDAIPGLSTFIDKGGDLLEKLGVAIGKFFGGLIGGIANGIISQFPEIGTSLSLFMTNLQPFIDGAKQIDNSVATGLKALVEAVVLLTATNILDAATSWLTGKHSFAKFGEQLSQFGRGFKQFYIQIKNVNPMIVQMVSQAIKSLILAMNSLPKTGGLIGKITGNKSLKTLVDGLVDLGPSLKTYSNSVKGLDTKSVIDSANAAKVIAGFVNEIPKQGGFIEKLVGKTNLKDFAESLADLAPSLKKYAEGVKGLDTESVIASTKAAQTIAEFSKNIPNSGGVISKIVGDNTLKDFADGLAEFGPSFKKYAESVKGLDANVVSNSVNAATTVSKMAEGLPNSGGALSYIVGDNTLSDFGEQLASFGSSFKQYYENIQNTNSKSVIDSADAGVKLTELVKNLPKKDKFEDLSAFGNHLYVFGTTFSEYAEAIKDIDGTTVIASANAAKALAEMNSNLPETGGLKRWIVGQKDLENFAEGLAKLAPALKAYASNIEGIKFDGETIEASANAAKALAEMNSNLPETGGLKRWIVGQKDLENFAGGLSQLGKSIKSYAENVSGVGYEDALSSAKAMASIVDVIRDIPQKSEIENLSHFGNHLYVFGNTYSNYVGVIKNITSSLYAVNLVTNTLKPLLEVEASLSNENYKSGLLKQFGEELNSFGNSFSNYYGYISSMSSPKLSSVVTETKKLMLLASSMNGFNTDGMTSFGKKLGSLGEDGVDKFVKAFNNSTEKVKKAATDMLEKFIDGAESKKENMAKSFKKLVENIIVALDTKKSEFETKAKEFVEKFINGIKIKSSEAITICKTMVNNCLININASQMEFFNAGLYLAHGFANGIDQNTYLAQAKAKEMSKAAVEAAKKELDEHSPSKVFYRIGNFAGLGFVNALGDYADRAYNEGTRIATSAREGLKRAIDKISETVENDIDTQPTIRPVLDLTNVSEGTRQLNSLLNSQRTYELASRTGYGFNYAMGNRQMNINVQNDDVVDAIGELRNDIHIMADVMGKMQVVMDTGALVGTIVRPMDSALGQLSIYKKRGI